MKLWLDDKRDPVEFTGETDWTWVKTAEEAINILFDGKVERVSLDHDLGPEYDTLDGFQIGNGYMVAKFIEEHAFMHTLPPLKWSVHSQNSVGVASMRKALENADRYWA
jgi:hypothetical protein